MLDKPPYKPLLWNSKTIETACLLSFLAVTSSTGRLSSAEIFNHDDQFNVSQQGLLLSRSHLQNALLSGRQRYSNTFFYLHRSPLPLRFPASLVKMRTRRQQKRKKRLFAKRAELLGQLSNRHLQSRLVWVHHTRVTHWRPVFALYTCIHFPPIAGCTLCVVQVSVLSFPQLRFTKIRLLVL